MPEFTRGDMIIAGSNVILRYRWIAASDYKTTGGKSGLLSDFHQVNVNSTGTTFMLFAADSGLGQ